MTSSTKTNNTPNDGTEFVSGIDLARMFYIEVVRPLIEGRTHSAARLGSGSDVLGFDTPRSTDHGWGPQLHLFVAASEVDVPHYYRFRTARGVSRVACVLRLG